MFRELVKLWHPDRFERLPELRELAEERLKEINDAYDKIKSWQSNEIKNTKPHVKKKKPTRDEKKDRFRVVKKESLEKLIKEWIPAGRAAVRAANRAVHAARDFTKKVASAIPTDIFGQGGKNPFENKNSSPSPGSDEPRPENGLKNMDDAVEKSFKEVFEEVAAAKRRRKKTK